MHPDDLPRLVSRDRPDLIVGAAGGTQRSGQRAPQVPVLQILRQARLRAEVGDRVLEARLLIGVFGLPR